MSDTMQQILWALLPALVIVLGILAAFLARWVQANVKNTTVRGMLLRLDDVVYTVVKEINQTVVDAARLPDGTLAPDAAAKAQVAALTKVKSYIGLEGLQLLMKVLGIGGDPDSFIASKIEAAVHDVKIVKASAASGGGAAAVPSGASPSAQPATP